VRGNKRSQKVRPEARSVRRTDVERPRDVHRRICDFSPILILETRHAGNFLPDLINTRARAHAFLFDGRDLITFLCRLVNHLAEPARRPSSSFLPSHKIKSFEQRTGTCCPATVAKDWRIPRTFDFIIVIFRVWFCSASLTPLHRRKSTSMNRNQKWYEYIPMHRRNTINHYRFIFIYWI